MNRLALLLCLGLLSSCAKQPEWQVVQDGEERLTRVHNKTGEVQFYYNGEWRSDPRAVKPTAKP